VVHVLESPSALVAVATAFGGAPVNEPQVEREAATAWLQELAAGIPGATAVLLEGEPAPAVQAWARDTGADLIVAARHHGLVERVLLGSFAGQVTHHAPCPVLLVPPGERAK
jgi:nucleotide-binding universal stress UspA family protein